MEHFTLDTVPLRDLFFKRGSEAAGKEGETPPGMGPSSKKEAFKEAFAGRTADTPESLVTRLLQDVEKVRNSSKQKKWKNFIARLRSLEQMCAAGVKASQLDEIVGGLRAVYTSLNAVEHPTGDLAGNLQNARNIINGIIRQLEAPRREAMGEVNGLIRGLKEKLNSLRLGVLVNHGKIWGAILTGLRQLNEMVDNIDELEEATQRTLIDLESDINTAFAREKTNISQIRRAIAEELEALRDKCYLDEEELPVASQPGVEGQGTMPRFSTPVRVRDIEIKNAQLRDYDRDVETAVSRCKNVQDWTNVARLLSLLKSKLEEFWKEGQLDDVDEQVLESIGTHWQNWQRAYRSFFHAKITAVSGAEYSEWNAAERAVSTQLDAISGILRPALPSEERPQPVLEAPAEGAVSRPHVVEEPQVSIQISEAEKLAQALDESAPRDWNSAEYRRRMINNLQRLLEVLNSIMSGSYFNLDGEKVLRRIRGQVARFRDELDALPGSDATDADQVTIRTVISGILDRTLDLLNPEEEPDYAKPVTADRTPTMPPGRWILENVELNFSQHSSADDIIRLAESELQRAEGQFWTIQGADEGTKISQSSLAEVARNSPVLCTRMDGTFILCHIQSDDFCLLPITRVGDKLLILREEVGMAEMVRGGPGINIRFFPNIYEQVEQLAGSIKGEEQLRQQPQVAAPPQPAVVPPQTEVAPPPPQVPPPEESRPPVSVPPAQLPAVESAPASPEDTERMELTNDTVVRYFPTLGILPLGRDEAEQGQVNYIWGFEGGMLVDFPGRTIVNEAMSHIILGEEIYDNYLTPALVREVVDDIDRGGMKKHEVNPAYMAKEVIVRVLDLQNKPRDLMNDMAKNLQEDMHKLVSRALAAVIRLLYREEASRFRTDMGEQLNS